MTLLTGPGRLNDISHQRVLEAGLWTRVSRGNLGIVHRVFCDKNRLEHKERKPM
jgi:hypothetical protein